MTPTALRAALAVSALLLTPIQAQTLVHQLPGTTAADRYGAAVSSAGDLNGDGHDDLIAGAPQSGTSPGFVDLLSGLDGALLMSLPGSLAGERFGASVAGIGDITGDGVPDVAVGAPFALSNGVPTGRADVFSGADGSLVFSFSGQSVGDQLGHALSAAGDVDLDGVPDVAVGAPFANFGLSNNGAVYLLSGADGSLLRRLNGPEANIRLGSSVAPVADCDGDGVDDLVVGAPFPNPFGTSAGQVFVFSAADGSIVRSWVGGSVGGRFGSSVDGAGDLDGDGIPEVVIGAPRASGGGSLSGRASVMSCADGSELFALVGAPTDGLGASVAGPGDVNGDGTPDILVGARQLSLLAPGYATLYSGADGTVVFTVVGDGRRDEFGFAVQGAGDVDGDGRPDVIVGATQAGLSQPGYARVFSIPVQISAGLSTVTASPTTISAYGGIATVTVTPRQPDGSLLTPGLVVSITTTTGTLLGSVADLGDGTYTQDLLADPQFALATVSASVDGTALTSSTIVTFASVDPDTSTVDARPSTISVGEASTITVVPRDGAGNALGSGLVVSIATTAGALVGAVVDHGDGTYTQDLEGTEAGTAMVTAQVEGIDLTAAPAVTVQSGMPVSPVVGLDGQGGFHPFTTIQSAVCAAPKLGLHTILVFPGDHPERVRLRQCTGLLIEGQLAMGAVRVRGFYLRNCVNVTIRGFEIEPRCSRRSGIKIRACRGISSGVVIDACVVRRARYGIVTGRYSNAVTIRNSIIEHSARDGVLLRRHTGGHQVEDSIIRCNGRHGMRVGRHAQVTIARCEITGNGTGRRGRRCRRYGYGILQHRSCGGGHPELITLIDNVLSGNRGRIKRGRSDRELGNYDQILDGTDSQPGYE